jgi:exopolysaccharide production protein ExoZ
MAEAAFGERRESYVFGIDIIRFFAAIMVASFHLTWQVADTQWILPFGWIGVEIFFVISGFVIANSAQASKPWRFVTGRVLRLYPAAWCCLPISYVALRLTPDHAYSNTTTVASDTLSVIQSIFLFGKSFIASAYWTIPIEITFYSVIFFLLLARKFALLKWAAMALVLVSAPYLALLFLNSVSAIRLPGIEWGYGLKNILLLRHGPFFALGMFVWLAKQGLLRTFDWLAVGLALVLGGMEIFARAVFVGQFFDAPIDGAFLTLGGLMAFALAFVAIVTSVRFNGQFPNSPDLRAIVRMLGLVTYPYYLLHEVIGGAIYYELGAFGMPLYLRLSTTLLAVGLCAFLVATLAEPFIRQRMKTAIDHLARPNPLQAR